MAAQAIHIQRTTRSRLSDVDLANVAFSSVFSDHMYSATHQDGQWIESSIQPFGPISILPSITALHYGISVFEGMKANKSPDGCALLFRSRENARRLQRSAARLAMPIVPETMFHQALHALVGLDRDWIPSSDVGALYVRPILFSVDPSVRVKPAETVRFIIFTFPFSAYFTEPVDVLVTNKFVRAFPGGTGDTKPAGNYGAALLADREARESGFTSVMWLDARERRNVEECGVMNVFFVLGDEIVTPALSGTILGGVTRDSAITLLRDMGHSVKEADISIDEIFASSANGRLRECFGTGTAATVSHVRRICYENQTLELPPIEGRTIGPLVKDKLLDVMTGRAPDPHGWVERVE